MKQILESLIEGLEQLLAKAKTAREQMEKESETPGSLTETKSNAKPPFDDPGGTPTGH